MLATMAAGAQQRAESFRVERPIVASGGGPQRLAVDVPLLARGQPFTSVRPIGPGAWRADGGLSDLRIYDGQDREVPYLLVHPAREPQWVTANLLPIAATKKTSGFEADLREVRTVDRLLVDGLPAPFLKRLVLEGSGDRARWTMLAAEGTVFDLPQERLQQSTIPFRPGAYRYLRVTWDDTNSGRVPLPAAVRARSVPGDALDQEPAIVPVAFQRRASEPGRSRYRLKLPAAALPAVAVRLDVGPGHVFRAASVSEARLEGSQAVPVELGRDTLARIERGGATAAALRIRMSPPREAELELVVDDGSNPPLDLKGVAVELAELPWIYFEAPRGSLIARYGNVSTVPRIFDLEALRNGLKLADVPEARWGEPVEATPVAAPVSPMPEAGAAIDADEFRHRRAIAAGFAGLTVLSLDVAALAHSQGPDRSFADVRIVDPSGRQVPYLLERRDEPVSVPLTLRPTSSTLAALRSEPGHNRSVYAVTLPYSGLPSPRLVLETSDRVFQRHVQVVLEHPPDRVHRDKWPHVLAATVWQHATPDVPAPAAVLALSRHEATELLLVMDEGDNRPLAVTRAQLLLPSWRIRFYSPPSPGFGGASPPSPGFGAASPPSPGVSGGREGKPQPLWLLYGHDRLPPPRYDLALLAPQLMGAEAREVEAAAQTSATAQPAFVTPRMFWMGLAVAVIALLAIIAKLVAGSSAVPSPPSQPSP